jgi:hypothetical protein
MASLIGKQSDANNRTSSAVIAGSCRRAVDGGAEAEGRRSVGQTGLAR